MCVSTIFFFFGWDCGEGERRLLEAGSIFERDIYVANGVALTLINLFAAIIAFALFNMSQQISIGNTRILSALA